MDNLSFRDVATDEVMETFTPTPINEMRDNDVFSMETTSNRESEMYYSLDEARKLRKFLSDIIMRYNKENRNDDEN